MTHVENLDGMGIKIEASQLDIKLHNGTITLKNRATGDHRTVRIATVRRKGDPFNGARRVSLLVGPDNGASYQDFGFITAGGRIVVYPSKRGVGKASFFEVVAKMLVRPANWEVRGVEYRISGTCRRCNRKLSHPDSIDSGLGPDCAGRAA